MTTTNDTTQKQRAPQWWRTSGFFLVAMTMSAMVWVNCGTDNSGKEKPGSNDAAHADQHKNNDKDTKTPPDTRTTNDQAPPTDRGEPPADRAEPPADRGAPPAKGTTYHEHVRSIVVQKCLGCHTKGGIGPFALTNYKETKAVAAAIKSAVASKRMPPWLADNSCGQYKHSLSLSEEQIKTITNWVDNGTKEGDPAKYVKPKGNGNIGIPRVDISLKMPVAYTPKPKTGTDDYRCFVIDWPKTEDTFVTGFQVKAGNTAIVHHVIAYLAEPKNKSKFTALDAKEEGPGYTCYGGSGGPSNWLAAWAPGKPGSEYPKGTGLLVKPGSVVILQVHYNTLQDKAGPDQTSIEFMTESKVDKQGYIIPISSTNWMIPAGKKDYKHVDIRKNPLPVPIQIHSVSFHMHLLGVSGRLFIERDGKEECMLNIPRWDFNWQFFYDRVKPMVVKPTDKIGIECRWNNSKENQPIVDGKRLTPRNVTWGDNTTDEMCLGVVYATPAL